MQSKTSSRQAGVGFIFITLLIDVMGWGLIIPVMPHLLSDMKHLPVDQVATSGAMLITAYAVTQFLFSPLIGNLSDRFGRRPVLLCSLFGFGVDYLFLALAPNYNLLFIGRIIAGITGASFTTGAAYIADISTPETRAKNFGMIGAAFGLGFILGPLVGGLLAGLGMRAPFYAAAGLCLLNWLYGYFVLPESLKPENRRAFDWKKANPVGSLKLFRRYPAISGLALSYFLIYLAAQSVQGNWNYFTIYRFHWNEKMVGISLAAVGLLTGLVQSMLTRKVNPLLGNERSIYAGLGLYATGLLLFAFASSTWMMFLFLVPYCLGGICGPSLQAVLATHVPPNEQGALQGALTSLMSLTVVFGPYMMSGLFQYFISPKAPFQFPGVSFMLGSLLMIGAGITTWVVLSKEKRMKESMA